MKMGRFDESIKSYQKALSFDRNFIASYIGMGNDTGMDMGTGNTVVTLSLKFMPDTITIHGQSVRLYGIDRSGRVPDEFSVRIINLHPRLALD